MMAMKEVAAAVVLGAVCLPVAKAAEEAKTAARWLETISDQQPDAQITDLRRGCMLEVTYRPMFKPKWDEDWKQCLERYRDWVSDEGDALIDKWLGGETLRDDERRCLPILKATYMFRVWNTESGGGPRRTKTPEAADEYVKQVVERGERILRKGFLGEALSREDIERLRDYLIYTAMKLTGARLLPFEVGASRGKHLPLTPAPDAPGFTLLSLEAALGRPSYTDELQQDDTAFLKPEGVAKLLEIMSYYESDGGDGRWCKPKPVHVALDSEGDYVQLSDFRGKRPVVLILAYAPDVFMKCCLPPLQVLYQAYKDRAAFLFVNINYHDTYAGGPVYFGPDAKPNGGRVTHPNSIEQRARMGKHIYMTYPSVTIPMLLDNMGQTTRNSYTAQGGDARFVIIDKAGRAAYDSPSSWYTWTKGNYTDTITWLNDMEIELCGVLANDGLADPDRKQSRPRVMKTTLAESRPAKRRAFANRQAKPYAYMKPWSKHTWLTGCIKSIDDETFVVTSELPATSDMKGYGFISAASGRATLDNLAQINLKALKQWIDDDESGTAYTFAIGDDVELFINGHEAEPSQFEVGDFVGVWYDLSQNPTETTVKPIQIRSTRTEATPLCK